MPIMCIWQVLEIKKIIINTTPVPISRKDKHINIPFIISAMTEVSKYSMETQMGVILTQFLKNK